MRDLSDGREALCETSEKGERLFGCDDLLRMRLSIAGRIMEVFGYQKLSNIVFRLRSTAAEVNSVINGAAMPSAEMLLAIRQTTGVSVDWLLTGVGEKFAEAEAPTPKLPLNIVRRPTLDRRPVVQLPSPFAC